MFAVYDYSTHSVQLYLNHEEHSGSLVDGRGIGYYDLTLIRLGGHLDHKTIIIVPQFHIHSLYLVAIHWLRGK